jgi:hypothetical protein
MKTGKLLTTAAGFILSAGVAMAAMPTTNSSKTDVATSSKTATHHLMGTISSVSASDLVVSHKYNGKQEESTFVINSSTKKEGSLAKGDLATVYYQTSNKRNVATDVKIDHQPPKS